MLGIVAMSILFIWDCCGVPDSGREALFILHDESRFFASRDRRVAESVEAAFGTK